MRAADLNAPSFAGARVLAADDSPVNREVVKEALGRLGVEVALATNGAEAVAALTREPFDLVLMDCSMPVMDGFAATEAIRALADNARARTPVIALTAHVEGDDKRWRRSGMNGYVTKPFTLATLAAVLAEHLSGDIGAGPAPLRDDGRPAANLRLFTAFDARALQNLAEMSSAGGDLVIRSLALFETHSREGMLRLASTVKLRDGKEIASAAHALKSMSLNIGAKAFGEACARVERSAGDFSALPALLKELRGAYAASVSEIPAVRRAYSREAA